MQRDLRGAYWACDLGLLFQELKSAETGLSDLEASKRLSSVSPGSWRATRGWSAVRLFLKQFKNPLVLILVFASGVSILLADWIEAGVVLIIVLASTLIAFTQEFSADCIFERLASRVRVLATVLRNGRERQISADQIVPGDVLVLRPGSLIAADSVILDADRLYVNEATLTGESFPVRKKPGPIAAETVLGDRSNCVFMGSSVESGHGTALVVRIAENTVFGQIEENLLGNAALSEFELSIQRFGQSLMRIMLVVVLFVLLINILREKPAIDTLLFSLALAVGLTPELLPAIVSVMLAHGARHLARRGVIVRKLNAIESLGGMTILCTDKTGTLTEGAAKLHAALGVNGESSEQVLRLAVLNASLQSGQQNPIDQAIQEAGKRFGVNSLGAERWDEIPLDYDRKCISIIASEDANAGTLITKGAFDQILSRCTTIGDLTVSMDEMARLRMLSMQSLWTARGYRVLAIAVRQVGRTDYSARPDDERDLCLMGILCFVDQPKSDTRKMIRELRKRGVGLKMITGDDDHVARYIAQAVDLPCDRLVTGAMLTRLNDQALIHVVAETHVFAEVDPNQKERIVRALQKTGAVVGFLGDGVNDALALHTADIGISVSNAVDVAREASDFVLLRKELRLICFGIDEGRRTLANTMKYVLSTTSANFGNMVSMGLLSFFLPFLPLLPSQVLLNNFLSDIPSAALAGDRVDAQWLVKPRRFDIALIRKSMILFGLISVCFDFVLFAILLWAMNLGTEQFRTAWFVESLLTELAVLLVIRSVRPFYQSRPSAILVWVTVLVALFGLCLPYISLGRAFELVPMPVWLVALIVVLTVLYAYTVELLKRWVFSRFRL